MVDARSSFAAVVDAFENRRHAQFDQRAERKKMAADDGRSGIEERRLQGGFAMEKRNSYPGEVTVN